MSEDLKCPVDHVTVNETRVRLVAFFVVLLTIGYLLTTSWIIAAFLLCDFCLRAFNLNAYSPLVIISGWLIKLFKLKNKPVDRAPKRFAAFIGLFFMAAILLCLFAGMLLLSKILACIILVFASLESFTGFCAGCYVYTLLKRVKLIKAN